MHIRQEGERKYVLEHFEKRLKEKSNYERNIVSFYCSGDHVCK